MKKQHHKKPNDYPRVTLRISRDLLDRLNALRKNSDLSFGQIFTQSVRRYLPELEKFHGSAALK